MYAMHRISKRGLGLIVASTGIAAMSSYACLPDPDTSGLPPRDAGTDTTYIPPTPIVDAGHDASDASTDAPVESGPVEAGPTLGTITGVVLDYSEGAARGVLPGAKITIAGSTITATSDARGAFVLPNVTAGKVVLNVSHATDKVNGIAYGTSQIVVPLLGGQTLNVFPVIHTGCTDTFNPTIDATSGMTRSIQHGCAVRSGVVASFHIDDIASLQLPGGALYAQQARIEFIPLGFPTTTGTDLSWSVGMPGDLSAKGGAIVPVGGAEIRVVVDSNDAMDGTPLQLVAGKRALLQIPIFRQPGGGETLTPWTYDTTQAEWVPDTTANQATFGTASAYDQPTDTTYTFDVLNVSVSHLSWWAVAKLRTDTGCIAGSLVAGGAPAAGVLVRGVGLTSFGASANVTDATGKFCLDGVASAGQASETISVVAGYAPPAGSLFTVLSTPKANSVTGHTCAADPSQCTQVGALTMTAVDPSCVVGKVLSNLGDTPITKKLDLRVVVPTIVPAQARAGVSNTAYVGQVQPGGDGTACVPSTSGATIDLLDPSGTACGTTAGQGATLIVPSGLGSGACGGGSCADAGTIRYYCASP